MHHVLCDAAVNNEILFGYNRSDTLTAEEVLKDGYGQCNTKATLLMALFRGSGISCRLHGSEVSKCFQRGATSLHLRYGKSGEPHTATPILKG